MAPGVSTGSHMLYKINFLLFIRNELFLAAHIRLQHLRDIHRTVGLQIVLQECYEHTRRGNNCIIPCMCKIVAVHSLDADAKTACLRITEVRAAADFKIFLLSRAPGFNITGLAFQVCQVS